MSLGKSTDGDEAPRLNRVGSPGKKAAFITRAQHYKCNGRSPDERPGTHWMVSASRLGRRGIVQHKNSCISG